MPVSTHSRLLAVGAALCLTLGSAFAADSQLPISHGERIDLRDHLEPGKKVVFAFYSAFSPACPCEPCGKLDNPLVMLDQAHDDVKVVLVDVDRPGQTGIDWSSPVVLQFGLRSLPHFKVYDGDGNLVVEDCPKGTKSQALDAVHAMLEALPEHSGSAVAQTVH